MSMKRTIILFRKNFVSSTLKFALTPTLIFLIIGLSHRFGGVDIAGFPIVDFLPVLIGGAAFVGFVQALQLEQINRTAEMLFSTPVTTREYMFSLWLRGVVTAVLVMYLAMGTYMFSMGIEHMAGYVCLLVWLQPLLLVITLVSGSGLIASIMLGYGSTIKKACYSIIIFAPIAIVMTLVWMMFIIRFISLVDLPESLPTWISWLLETLQAVGEMTPSFIYSPWARWIPTSVYMLVWFFILSRKIHIGNFIRPVVGWRSMFIPW